MFFFWGVFPFFLLDFWVPWLLLLFVCLLACLFVVAVCDYHYYCCCCCFVVLFGWQRPIKNSQREQQNPLFKVFFVVIIHYRSLATERPTAQGHQKKNMFSFFPEKATFCRKKRLVSCCYLFFLFLFFLVLEFGVQKFNIRNGDLHKNTIKIGVWSKLIDTIRWSQIDQFESRLGAHKRAGSGPHMCPFFGPFSWSSYRRLYIHTHENKGGRNIVTDRKRQREKKRG